MGNSGPGPLPCRALAAVVNRACRGGAWAHAARVAPVLSPGRFRTLGSTRTSTAEQVASARVSCPLRAPAPGARRVRWRVPLVTRWVAPGCTPDGAVAKARLHFLCAEVAPYLARTCNLLFAYEIATPAAPKEPFLCVARRIKT